MAFNYYSEELNHKKEIYKNKINSIISNPNYIFKDNKGKNNKGLNKKNLDKEKKKNFLDESNINLLNESAESINLSQNKEDFFSSLNKKNNKKELNYNIPTEKNNLVDDCENNISYRENNKIDQIEILKENPKILNSK